MKVTRRDVGESLGSAALFVFVAWMFGEASLFAAYLPNGYAAAMFLGVIALAYLGASAISVVRLLAKAVR